MLGMQAIPVTAPVGTARTAQPPDGITVRGFGTATATATTATISLYVAARNNAVSITSATLVPIEDALVRAGIARSDIVMPLYMAPQARTNNATMTATVRQPTTAMIQNGITQLAMTFAATPDLLLSSAQVRLLLDDCGAAHRQAESAALKEARANAESIARQLGLHIGAVAAVDVQSGSLTPEGQCSSMYSIGPYQNMPFASPDDYLKVRVYSNISIRYAIR